MYAMQLTQSIYVVRYENTYIHGSELIALFLLLNYSKYNNQSTDLQLQKLSCKNTREKQDNALSLSLSLSLFLVVSVVWNEE